MHCFLYSASKIVELVKQLNARKVDPEELKQFINDHPGCIKDAGKEVCIFVFSIDWFHLRLIEID